jgi:hypothetical protein
MNIMNKTLLRNQFHSVPENNINFNLKHFKVTRRTCIYCIYSFVLNIVGGVSNRNKKIKYKCANKFYL